MKSLYILALASLHLLAADPDCDTKSRGMQGGYSRLSSGSFAGEEHTLQNDEQIYDFSFVALPRPAVNDFSRLFRDFILLCLSDEMKGTRLLAVEGGVSEGSRNLPNQFSVRMIAARSQYRALQRIFKDWVAAKLKLEAPFNAAGTVEYKFTMSPRATPNTLTIGRLTNGQLIAFHNFLAVLPTGLERISGHLGGTVLSILQKISLTSRSEDPAAFEFGAEVMTMASEGAIEKHFAVLEEMIGGFAPTPWNLKVESTIQKP